MYQSFIVKLLRLYISMFLVCISFVEKEVWYGYQNACSEGILFDGVSLYDPIVLNPFFTSSHPFFTSLALVPHALHSLNLEFQYMFYFWGAPFLVQIVILGPLNHCSTTDTITQIPNILNVYASTQRQKPFSHWDFIPHPVPEQH